MQRIINHLIQLQELYVARAQQEASMPGARLTQLDESIKTLANELPPDIHNQFVRLEKRGPLAIVPVAVTVCSACGMSLPVSLVHQVKAAEKLHQCPNCARLLYFPSARARNTRPNPRRSEAPKVGIERFSSQALMIPALAGNDRDSVMAELCQKLAAEGFVDNADKLLDDALRREAIVSTAVDHGIAFPHVRGVEGGALSLALGIHPKGIKFNGSARNLTRIVFFIIIPTAASAFYLKLLAGLSQAFLKEESRQKLLDAGTPEKLWKALIKTTRTTIQ